MCLGIPGQVIQKYDNVSGIAMGKVKFGGITKEVCLTYVPEAEVGDYVVVHVGFALSKLDEEEAMQVFQYLNEMEELAELQLQEQIASR